MEDVIRAAVNDALRSLHIEAGGFSIEHPENLAFGDYACNVALMASKEAGEAPRTIAEKLARALEGQIEYVDRIEIAGPGFLNFYFARDFFTLGMSEIIDGENERGVDKLYEGKEVLIEYTSPNLFKPLHVGNLVGNIVGESIARLFAYEGANVHRINYPSDIGLTVAKGVWGLLKTEGDPSDINALGEAYRVGSDAYENDPAAKEAIEAVNRDLYAGTDEALNTLRERGIATSRARLDELCRTLGTTFDTVIFESEASVLGKDIVEAHIGDVFEKSDGAVVYKGEQDGLHTRVFLNSQGLPTYEAKDLGNFSIKQAKYPSWDLSIIVTGNEQAEYFKVLYAAMRKVFKIPEEKELAHIKTGFLTLSTGKMSSRKGNVLTGESILAELEGEAMKRAAETRTSDIGTLSAQVAVAALKYQILRHTLGSDIVFDKEKALSFEGDSGPYLQYTHARIASVIEKARMLDIVPSAAAVPPEAYMIERILYRYEEVVKEAAAECAPQHVVTYLTELAGAFNTFYGREKIADASDPYAAYKCMIAEAVRIVLRKGLDVLGMSAPKNM